MSNILLPGKIGLSPFEVTALHQTRDNTNFEFFVIIMQARVKGWSSVRVGKEDWRLRWGRPSSLLCLNVYLEQFFDHLYDCSAVKWSQRSSMESQALNSWHAVAMWLCWQYRKRVMLPDGVDSCSHPEKMYYWSSSRWGIKRSITDKEMCSVS